MIPFASQRGGGQDLATHLMNAYENEAIELDSVRGAIARDLHGAFKEWQMQAECLTRCQKYLYSLSINPDPAQAGLTRDQYMDYIDRTEKALGLQGQPRAIVFHVKNGREHCHVAWSRINAMEGKAVHIAFDKQKLMDVTRAFARDHGLKLPAGYERGGDLAQRTLYEQAQMQNSGLSQEDHKRFVTEAWQLSDTPAAFVNALSERGYILATGNRPYVVVDLYGNMNALPKLIDDKTVRTKDVVAFLESEYPPESLPTVDEAKALASRHRDGMKDHAAADWFAGLEEELVANQKARRADLETVRDSQIRSREKLVESLEKRHRMARGRMRAAFQERRKEAGPKVSAREIHRIVAMVRKATGIDHVMETLRRRAELRRFKEFKVELGDLAREQKKELRISTCELLLKERETLRLLRSLGSIEAREWRALERDKTAEARVFGRGVDGQMPSLMNHDLQIKDQLTSHNAETTELWRGSPWEGAKDRER